MFVKIAMNVSRLARTVCSRLWSAEGATLSTQRMSGLHSHFIGLEGSQRSHVDPTSMSIFDICHYG
jgi:hypothetical protein